MADRRPVFLYLGKERVGLQPSQALYYRSWLYLLLNDGSTQQMLVGGSRAVPLLLNSGATASLVVGLNG